VIEDSDLLRSTFDQDADLYDQARPDYPQQVFDDIIDYARIPPSGRILEIGCGTGQATLPFARRGYRLLCVELGANLAATARRKLSAYPLATVVTGAFEQWPMEPAAFDLALSATAFHWIDPAVGYPKAARALRPGGALALCWNKHVHSDSGAAFFAAAQEVYRREAPAIANEDRQPIPRAEEVVDPARAIFVF
jgi:SAM-dependent methyltransferase